MRYEELRAEVARLKHFQRFAESPRWKSMRNPADVSLFRALVAAEDPTAVLVEDVRDTDLIEVLRLERKTLGVARARLIARGLIVDYQPPERRGRPGTYVLAESWADADQAATERWEARRVAACERLAAVGR